LTELSLFERLKSDTATEWATYCEHQFVKQMGNGSLPEECFRHYLVQDYLFLIQFARAYALAIYKAPSLELMRSSHDGLKAILDVEMQLHLKLCQDWGLSASEVEQVPEARATIAYTRFVLEAGQSGDLLDLYTALAPCMIGYGEIGARLAATPDGQKTNNPYSVWISEYSSDEYQEIANGTIELLDRLAEIYLTEARYSKLQKLFRQATLLEADFWQMGLDLAE
jgi:thiaminase/transcriptional activator TenA